VRLARIHPRGSKDEQGYVLLLMLFLAAMLIIAMTAAAPYLTTQIKRDREIEMIHRGEQYARAVKRYYRKFGRYPGRIEDLEKTNNIRFLRKRYKDPMSADGGWRLVRFGEVQMGGAQALAGATPVSNLASGAQPGSSFGGGSTFGSGNSSNSGSSFGAGSGSSSSSGSSFGGSQNTNQSGTSGTDTPNSGTTAQSSSLLGSRSSAERVPSSEWRAPAKRQGCTNSTRNLLQGLAFCLRRHKGQRTVDQRSLQSERVCGAI